MAIRQFSSARAGVKSTKLWNGITAQGALDVIAWADGADSSIEFLNIPQTYQDLMMIINVRDKSIPGPKTSLYWGVNGSAVTGDYIWTSLYGDGTSVTSDRSSANQWTAEGVPGYNATAGIFSTLVIHILDYTNTGKFKTMYQRSGCDMAGSGAVTLHHGTWKQTSAISSIQLRNTFISGSKVTLYGIKGTI